MSGSVTRTALLDLWGTLRERHGLDGWRLVLDRSKVRDGQCRYAKREIGLSAYFVTHNTLERVTQTLLHEVAHALTQGHDHDGVWLAKARSIGFTGGARYSPADTVMPKPRWRITCPCGNIDAERHRVSASIRSATCNKCRNGIIVIPNR